MLNEGYNCNQADRNMTAEIGVLGSILVAANEVADEVIHMLDRSYFSIKEHMDIFSAVQTVYYTGETPDCVNVEAVLRSMKVKWDKHYLITVMESVFSGANAESYAQIVQENGIRRNMVNACLRIKGSCEDPGVSFSDLLDMSEKYLHSSMQKVGGNEPFAAKEIVSEILNDISTGKAAFEGVPTGYSNVDDIISGFENEGLIIIAGRPSMGKTTFAINIGAVNVAVLQKKTTLIFSLEMKKSRLLRNAVASMSFVDHEKMDNPNEHDYKAIMESAGLLSDAKLFVDDAHDLNLREIIRKSRKYKKKENIELIVIDYIQLIDTKAKKENRNQEVAHISKKLKSLARELKVPIIALSQLNRGVDAREGHRPRMSDLKESGSLEQDADLIIFLYREDYYQKKDENVGDVSVVDIMIEKNRNGKTGLTKLLFQKKRSRFMLASRSTPPPEYGVKFN